MSGSSAAAKSRLGEFTHRKLRRTVTIVRIAASLALAIIHSFQEGAQSTAKSPQPHATLFKLMLLQSHSDACFDHAIRATLFAISISLLLFHLTAAPTESISDVYRTTHSSNAITNSIQSHRVSGTFNSEEPSRSASAAGTVV